jgi:hypothetical protein
MRGGGFVVVLCFLMTLFYVWKADVTLKAKAIVLLLYAASFVVGFVVETTVPLLVLIQVALCIYYVIYLKYT